MGAWLTTKLPVCRRQHPVTWKLFVCLFVWVLRPLNSISVIWRRISNLETRILVVEGDPGISSLPNTLLWPLIQGRRVAKRARLGQSAGHVVLKYLV